MSNEATPAEVELLDAIYNEGSDASFHARLARRIWDLSEVPPVSTFSYDVAYNKFMAESADLASSGNSLEDLLDSSIPSVKFDAGKAFAKFQLEVKQETQTTPVPTMAPVKEATVRRLNIRRMASIAAVMLCVLATVFLLQQDQAFTTDGTVASVMLEDGSNVVIAPGSKVEVISDRAVRLEGNAFFDIEHNPSKPFTVELSQSAITVLGTSFTVEDKGDYAEISLREGSVRLEDEDESITIKPGEKAIAVNGKLLRATVLSPNAYSLATGYLTFDQTPIEQVLGDLMRHYNMSLSSNLDGCTLTASRLDLDSGVDALDRVAKVLGAEVIMTDQGYHLQGTSCN